MREKPETESFVVFARTRFLRDPWHFLNEKFLNFGCIDSSRCLNRIRILKFVNFSKPDSESKILEDVAGWSLIL